MLMFRVLSLGDCGEQIEMSRTTKSDFVVIDMGGPRSRGEHFEDRARESEAALGGLVGSVAVPIAIPSLPGVFRNSRFRMAATFALA